MYVLLVEDEVMIREVMAESLHEAGYQVVEASDGHAAILAIHNHETRLSLIVTDFHMPGEIDGRQVAIAARQALPDVPVVIATGRPDVLVATWQDELGCRLLKKPYLPSGLLSMAQELVKPSD